MGRLIQADRRATLTEITTRYNRGMQQSICEATTSTTLRRMGNNSRRPYREILVDEMIDHVATHRHMSDYQRMHENVYLNTVSCFG